MLVPVIFLLLLLAIPLASLRLISVLRHQKPISRKVEKPTRLLVILGSGGHTAEMFALLRNLDTAKYHHRSYVISSGDSFSALKAKEFERGLADTAHTLLKSTAGPINAKQRAPAQLGRPGFYGSYDVAVIPRARRIHQSLLTTPYSCLHCIASCFSVLRSPDHTSLSGSFGLQAPKYPDLIMSNGPATAVIVILASLLLRFTGLPGTSGKMRTIYVESWARVRRLSLSGKILVRIVDRFLVQWEGLVGVTGGKGEYLGVLV